MSAQPVCAITGCNGYVGGAIKNFFAAANWEVLEMTRRPRAGTQEVPFELGGKVDPAVFAGVQALVHCAYDFRPLRREDLRRVNVEGSRELFAAARAAKVPHVIFISSISAFDGCRSLYGQTKLEIEALAREYGALVIRPALVYGDNAGGMFGRVAKQISHSTFLPLIGGGRQIQYLVHEEDLARFIEHAAAGKIDTAGQIVTAAHPQPWEFKELLRTVGAGYGRKIKFIPLPWRILWSVLKITETIGFPMRFRSDSLVSLMYQNPSPDFSQNEGWGLHCRPFQFPPSKPRAV